MTPSKPLSVCVIGGGFTGAVAAIACLQRIAEPFHLTIVEPLHLLDAVSPMAATVRYTFSTCARATSRFLRTDPGTRRSKAGFAVNLKHGASLMDTLNADLAFDCRGLRPDLRSTLIGSVVDQGLARADPHHLGLAVKPDGRVLAIHGVPTPGLYALGPLCQGSLWEIMAVPEIVRQADLAASEIARAAPLSLTSMSA